MPTFEPGEPTRLLHVALRTDQRTDQKVRDRHQQNDQQTDLRLGLPLHAHHHDHRQYHDRDAANDPDVLDAAIDDADAERVQQIVDRLAEAHHVHGARHRIGQREYQADRAAKLGTQRPRYHVVGAAALDHTVRADGGHGQRRDARHNGGRQDEHDRLDDAGLTDHPAEAQEQHDAPNVEQTSHQHALDPAELDDAEGAVAAAEQRGAAQQRGLWNVERGEQHRGGLGVELLKQARF